MMKLIRAVAIFCEDLREEKSGQDILIGTMPDNLGLPSVPVILPKLAVYLRAYFEVSSRPRSIKGWIRFPWGQTIDLGEADESLVGGAIRQAKEQKNPLAGVILKGLFSPVAVQSFGVVTAHIKIGKEESLCGMLNFAQTPTSAPIASPPV